MMPERICPALYFQLECPPPDSRFVLIQNPHEIKPEFCQPLGRESWLDTRAGDQILWSHGELHTVIAVLLPTKSIMSAEERIITCGRDWEQAGCGIDGEANETRVGMRQ